MIVTEAIEKLKCILEEHGDVPVVAAVRTNTWFGLEYDIRLAPVPFSADVYAVFELPNDDGEFPTTEPKISKAKLRTIR